MKKSFSVFIFLAIIACSKQEDSPTTESGSLKGTAWAFTNETDESSIALEFKNDELAILTISTFVELPDNYDLYPGPTYKEERRSDYFYDYVLVDGKVYLTVSTSTNWSFNGNLYVMPKDRFDMPSLTGSISGNRLLLLKNTSETYAILNKL